MLPKDYKGIVYQIIRPTGLLDPIVEIRPIFPENFQDLKKNLKLYGYDDMPIYKKNKQDIKSQVQDVLLEINLVLQKKQRVLVITLTKKMSEELAEYLLSKGINCKYIHSDIDTVERVDLLRDLRKGVYDVLVGINLLREGLDLPEVSLIAILDADKEGFLRSKTSLIQIIGRAARHEEGRVIMYADKITKSMKEAIDETRKRRKIQEEYNIVHGITPRSIKKEIVDQLEKFREQNEEINQNKSDLIKLAESYKTMNKKEKQKLKKELKLQMQIYSDLLEFEKAAEIRDILKNL